MPRWTGPVLRMDDDRLPKQTFFSELATGTRPQGGQLNRYKDSLSKAPSKSAASRSINQSIFYFYVCSHRGDILDKQTHTQKKNK